MIADEVADAILFLRGLGMHLCAEPSMSLYPTFILMGMPHFVPVPSPQRHTRAQWETRRYESGVEWEKPSRPESRGLWKGYCLGVIR